MNFNINLIKDAIYADGIVSMFFEPSKAYILTRNGTKQELELTDSEPNMLRGLEKGLKEISKIYFSPLNSTCCKHAYNIRAI